MDYRRRSFAMNERDFDSPEDSAFWTTRMAMSPTLSRRRSASPLITPGMSSSGRMSVQMIERNRKEASFPQSEEEHLYLYHEKIIWCQERSLLPLCHDLADWMNTVLGINITPCTLMETLETGVMLCRLAKLIETKAASTPGEKKKPKFRGRFKENARKGSFFARDNVAQFINFCKDELGVHANLLFETEDIVSHGEVRSVLICLLEVGRLSVKFGLDPPSLVALEHQIDREAMTSASEGDSHRATTTDESDSQDENKENPKLSKLFLSTSTPANLSDSLDSGLPTDEYGGGDRTNEGGKEDFLAQTELDIKVDEVARISGKHCCCVEETRRNFKLRRLSEGKYLINGRTVFVRLLKGVHVMVRIGGGWETLEEFLVRNDPCRFKNGYGRRRSAFGVSCGNNGGRPVSSPPVMGGDSRSRGTTASSSTISSLVSSGCSTPTGNTRSRIPSLIPNSSRHSSRNSLFT